MRKTWMLGTVLASFVALAPLAAFGQSDGGADQSYARLSYVKGDVSVDRGEELGTESAEVNLPLAEGNVLVTGDGQAEVQFGRGNFLRLGVSSEAEFAALPVRSADPVKIHFRTGQAYLRVTTLEAEKGIEIHTTDASFYILETGLYRFDVDEGGATEILVHEGSAEAAGEGGSAVVRANERLVAANGKFRSDPESFNAAMDGFDRWNETRDGLLDRGSGSSYLPSSISEYGDELEDNGRWVREASFGYVWVPYIHDLEWRPYMYGRWVWYPIIGWTWVSSEPWGWCTYHYGRWQWRFGLGWYWIPTSHWGSAWVHWYHGRDHYGWCPLSYYNRPGVIIDGRYHDRWSGDQYPWNSRALTVVRRDRLQSPAISRHALKSSELGALGRISVKAEQPSVRPAAGRAGLASPISKRVLSGSGSRPAIKERGSLSGGALRSPTGIDSKSRTWTQTSRSSSAGRLSGSVSGPVSKLRTYPSRSGDAKPSGATRPSAFGKVRPNDIVERPSGLRSGSSSGGIGAGVSRSSSRPFSSIGKSSSRGAAMGYSSTLRNKSAAEPYPRRSGGVREYAPSSSIKSSGSRSYSRSGPIFDYGSPRSSSGSYSPSAPSYSGRSYSSSPGSLLRSPGVYSGSSASRNYGNSRSSGSSKSAHSTPSRSSSSSRSGSSSHSPSSSGRSGSIRKK
jgi:hypothetical protein